MRKLESKKNLKKCRKCKIFLLKVGIFRLLEVSIRAVFF